jgi:hypothetical protein
LHSKALNIQFIKQTRNYSERRKRRGRIRGGTGVSVGGERREEEEEEEEGK